ncbi:Dof-type domain-containing protein [Caenorhabditis elegans]|uniref:Dof-type domain-containing protein n=1 Tax=Caenorhabditis elegans TaxID=6239 RepID=A3QM99_CAEEL|nr:Dof-type domain-containing protein [Caenorhabditis elegans]CAM36331.1 Dof-type domain-containing protein [Caenorhabditis elegans]|eukprot:NP_496611.1 Uncharacterized protein CELE_C50E10.1 [Caenorhabditis elegans]
MDMDKRSSDLEAALRIVLQQTLNIVLQAQEKLPEANVVPSTPPTSPSTDIGEQMASFWNIPSPNPPATSATSSTSPEEEIPCICFNCWGNVAAAANSKTWKSPNQADFRSAAAPLTEEKSHA